MSFDDTDEIAEWAAEEGFQYEVWSDVNKELALYYGAASSSSSSAPSRVTMLLDAEGTLVLEYVEDIVLGTHPQEVLDDCAALFGD